MGQSFVGIEEQDVLALDQLKVEITAGKMAGMISDRQLIGEVLDSLPSTLRIPLLLRDMDELTYEEVAQCMGISMPATKMRIKRAREVFRERYDKAQSASMALRSK